MKKTISMILTIAMMLTLVAIGGQAAFAADVTVEQADASINTIFATLSSFKQSGTTAAWRYAVTDLDHNGRMEVIADYIAGSSFLTYSNCFEVNENMDGIASCLTENQNYSILQIQEELP